MRMTAERIALIVLSAGAIGFGAISSSHGDSKKAGIDVSPGTVPAAGHTTVWIVDTTDQTATVCHFEIGKDKVDCHAAKYAASKAAP
jgi:hypothetical protein